MNNSDRNRAGLYSTFESMGELSLSLSYFNYKINIY